MKYKLIKKYPSLNIDWQTNDVVVKLGNGYYSNDRIQQFISLKEVENQPEFWAKYLFTTEDNVGVFEREDFWVIDRDYIIKNWVAANMESVNNNFIYLQNKVKFSTKEAAEKWIEENKEPKYKVGEWLWFDNSHWQGIFRFKSAEWDHYTTTETYYKLKGDHYKEEVAFGHFKKDWNIQKATQEQIEEVLSEVARQKGFVNGVKFKSAYSGVISTSNGEFHISHGDLNSFGGLTVYSGSARKWAEIVGPAQNKLSFGNKTVTLERYGDKVYVSRKSKKTELRQFIKLYKSLKFIHSGFEFRERMIDSIHGGAMPDSFDDMEIKIGCTVGTVFELKQIIDAGKLLKKNV